MCTSPLFRIPVGSRNFFLLADVDQRKKRNGGVILSRAVLDSYSDLPLWLEDEVQTVGCGQCTTCRLNDSKQWAIRCSLEAEYHDHNYFITLTYDDFHLPKGEFLDFDGEIKDSTLRKRDVQLFIKSLREWERTHNNRIDLKVFLCGEYGDINGRPHYHIIVFGASDWTSHLLKSFKRGSFQYYKSPVIERFWHSSETGLLRGFVDISEASFDTIAYTARYVMKKVKGLAKKEFFEFYDSLDPSERPDIRQEVFLQMSRRPGIAARYFSEHKDQILLEDLVKYLKKYKVFKAKPPRYFDYLINRDYPKEAVGLKARRRLAGKAARAQRYRLCSEPVESRLFREDSILKAKLKKYVRCI